MKFVLVAATVAALCVACGTKRNEERCLEGLCSDPDLPFCDVDGTIAGEPNACIAVDCTPGEVASCRDDRALTCNAGGTNYDLVDCPYGCDANGCKPCTTPECEKTIIPRYVPSACDEIAPGDPRVISANASIDTTSDLNCSDIVTQPSGVDICIVRYSALTIEQNQTLRITGSRAVAIVVDHDLDVAGIVDVGGRAGTNGAGGGAIRSGTCTGTTGGCGGAGYRAPGGSGGGSGVGTNGGAAESVPTTLVELRGGTRSNTGNSIPGPAGGAATLISCRGRVRISGSIDANGGGGGGDSMQIPAKQAGGGGSGGTVVLQGVSVIATGQFYANGGGGGGACGGSCDGQTLSSGPPGEDGSRSTQTARGGQGLATGGYGGASPNLGGGNGTSLPSNPANGGGGGGSTGFFLTYAPEAAQVTVSPQTASPPFLPTQVLATK
jgi:hypothetical protein